MTYKLQSRFVAPKSTPEAIVRFVSERIGAGEFRPGDKLPTETEFSKMLGVAPMTLRSALAILRDLGLVVTLRGRHGGTYIRDNGTVDAVPMERADSMGALRALTDLRQAISGEAAYRCATRCTAQQLARLVEYSRMFDEHVYDVNDRRAVDAELHLLITEGSGSCALLDEERKIQGQLTKLIVSLPIVPTVEHALHSSHTPLLDAIRDHDGERARREMVAHAESTYDWCYSLASKVP